MLAKKPGRFANLDSANIHSITVSSPLPEPGEGLGSWSVQTKGSQAQNTIDDIDALDSSTTEYLNERQSSITHAAVTKPTSSKANTGRSSLTEGIKDAPTLQDPQYHSSIRTSDSGITFRSQENVPVMNPKLRVQIPGGDAYDGLELPMSGPGSTRQKKPCDMRSRQRKLLRKQRKKKG